MAWSMFAFACFLTTKYSMTGLHKGDFLDAQGQFTELYSVTTCFFLFESSGWVGAITFSLHVLIHAQVCVKLH